ncbi:MAG: hypothetical protein J6S67_07565 [Methanobrevibacter sp.]|nr:hypothetical protein [Methanobrevibacter sp.]
MGYYEYSQYSNFNRFINIDGIEAKIIEHLINSNTKYANIIWQLLKYPSRDALWQKVPTKAERTALIESSISSVESSDMNEKRLFCKPFSDDAVKAECSVMCLYIGEIYPVDATQSVISLIVELATHNHINLVAGEADSLAHPDITNPNDYYYTNDETPVVQYKSRESLLLKCVLAELNGLYIDGVGYVQFNTHKLIEGRNIGSKVTMSVYDGRSFFGHKIQFNIPMSGMSEDADYGY